MCPQRIERVCVGTLKNLDYYADIRQQFFLYFFLSSHIDAYCLKRWLTKLSNVPASYCCWWALACLYHLILSSFTFRSSRILAKANICTCQTYHSQHSIWHQPAHMWIICKGHFTSKFDEKNSNNALLGFLVCLMVIITPVVCNFRMDFHHLTIIPLTIVS